MNNGTLIPVLIPDLFNYCFQFVSKDQYFNGIGKKLFSSFLNAEDIFLLIFLFSFQKNDVNIICYTKIYLYLGNCVGDLTIHNAC